MLTFFGMCKIKPDKAKQFEKALQAYHPHLMGEEGTVKYIVYRGTKNPLLFSFSEIYKDEAANKAHHASPNLQEFLRVLRESGEEGVIR